MSKRMLWIEFISLFVALPVLFSMLPMKGGLFLILWVLAISCMLLWRKQTGRTLRSLWDWKQIPKNIWNPLLIRFLLCALVMAIFTLMYDPNRFLSLPMDHPLLWLMVMLFYPLLSVIPQEMLYRVYFFARYAPIFRNDRIMVLASGLAFGHAHIMFHNWVAYTLSIIGGIIFAETYARTRSFTIVWVEHALYGCFLFTIGLGWYFYSGAQM
jgi:uncharacterized protein